MRINQNIAAFNAYRNLNNTQTRLQGSLEKLSSGFRINRAADDASGLVNSENLRSQIGGLKVATRNAQDAISLVQTAEGAQTEVHSILQRMRDLAVQAGNTGTNDSVSLAANQAEITELQAELDRIGNDTQFGTLKVFQDFQVADAVGTINAGTVTLATTATSGAAAVSASAAQTGQATTFQLTGLGASSTTGGVVTVTVGGDAVDGSDFVFTVAEADASDLNAIAAAMNTTAFAAAGFTAAVDDVGNPTELVITGPETSDTITVTAEQDGSATTLTGTGAAAGQEEILASPATATTLELTVPSGGLAVPAGYDGQVEFTLSAGGLSSNIVVSVAADATAAQIAAAFNAEDGISATVDNGNVVISGADGETATFSLAATHGAQEARDAVAGAVFQIGANDGQTETLEIKGVSAVALEVDDIDVTVDAGAAITAIDGAIETVSNNRADLGAFQNRMESLTRNLSVAVENLSAAESRIRDTDMALEMVEFTRNQILSQAGTAMLAQANVVPQSVLSLLG